MVIKMKVKIEANIITCRVYDKKDNNKNLTGEKGLTNISFLTDSDDSSPLSGTTITATVKNDEYSGPFDFSDFKRLQPVEIVLNSSVYDGKERYQLLSLKKIDNKK